MPRLTAAFVLAALALVASTSARANGRFPEANQVAFDPNGGPLIVVRTTFGVLLSRDAGASFRYVCEPFLSIRNLEDPAIGVFGDGSILLSMFAGQRRSANDCEWNFVDPRLEGVVVIDHVIDPTDNTRAYALTSSGGEPNGVWVGTESGAAWAPLGPRWEGVLFETVEVAPSNPNRLYLTGAIPPSDGSPRRPFVYRSDDRGETWETIELPLEASATQNDRNYFLSAVDPLDENRVFFRVLGVPDDKLLVSEDGGDTMHEVARIPNMLGFVRNAAGDSVWIGSPAAGLFRSRDRGETFERIADVMVSCLGLRGDELFACGKESVDGFSLGRSVDDGATFEPVMRFSELAGIPACGISSELTIRCSADFEGQAILLGIDLGVPDMGPRRDASVRADATTEPSPNEPGGCDCGVATNPSPSDAAFVLGLILLVRGRGTRRRPRGPRR